MNTKGEVLYVPYRRYTNRQVTNIPTPLLTQVPHHYADPYILGNTSLSLPTAALYLFLFVPYRRSTDKLFQSNHMLLQAVIHRFHPVQMFQFQEVPKEVHFQE